MSARGEAWWRVYAVLARGLALVNRVPIGDRSVTIGGHPLYASSVDRWLALMSWKLGIGERRERALVARVARPAMIAVDVGANVGIHTLGLASRLGREGRVHAVEPEPENFRLLARAVAASGLANVRLHQVAASDQSGPRTLYLSDANRGDHRTVPTSEARRSIRVNAVALDDLLADEPCVDFVKIDAQGAETIVLRGFDKTIRRSSGIGVLCEVGPELLERAGSSASELLGLFEAAGLRPHRLLDRGETAPIDAATAIAQADQRGYLTLYFTRG